MGFYEGDVLVGAGLLVADPEGALLPRCECDNVLRPAAVIVDAGAGGPRLQRVLSLSEAVAPYHPRNGDVVRLVRDIPYRGLLGVEHRGGRTHQDRYDEERGEDALSPSLDKLGHEAGDDIEGYPEEEEAVECEVCFIGVCGVSRGEHQLVEAEGPVQAQRQYEPHQKRGYQS